MPLNWATLRQLSLLNLCRLLGYRLRLHRRVSRLHLQVVEMLPVVGVVTAMVSMGCLQVGHPTSMALHHWETARVCQLLQWEAEGRSPHFPSVNHQLPSLLKCE